MYHVREVGCVYSSRYVACRSNSLVHFWRTTYLDYYLLLLTTLCTTVGRALIRVQGALSGGCWGLTGTCIHLAYGLQSGIQLWCVTQ
jgi:hypothetical protein